MSGGLLDCVVCAARKWRNTDVPTADELRSAGATKLFCDNCGRYTYWLLSRSAQQAVPRQKQSEAAAQMAAGVGVPPGMNGGTATSAPLDRILSVYHPERRKGTDRRETVRRTERRVALQVPVRLRVAANGTQFEEVTRTLNVCRSGIYFQSERPYSKGQSAFVALHYSPREPGQLAEQRGTVVRVDPIPGSSTKGVAIQLR